MSDYQFQPDDYRLADDIFRRCIEDNLAEEDNLAVVKDAFVDVAGQAWKEGSFTVVVEKLVVDHFWQRVNNRAGSATGKFLRDIAAGQAIAEFDEWLDTPITAGKHRRTTIRHYNRVDNARVLAERADNLEKQKASYETAQEATGRLNGALAIYGDIAAWIAHDPAAMRFNTDEAAA